MGLNREQEKAAAHYKGPCMVLAGPGSGKTYTIARRIQYLIEQYKVRPEEILVITFTRAASYEMRSRFARLMKSESMPVTFGTFHGVYFGILKWAFGLDAGNILTEDNKYQMLRQILYDPGTGFELDFTDEKEEIRDLLAEIGSVKNQGMKIEDYESARYGPVFQNIFEAYEKQRKRMRKVDFDDMLLLCHELFKERPDVLKQWQARFRYILIDEFQDINRIQYEVIRMLALPENNLFVVGDDDQSIYRFRGADPEIMLGFEADYPGSQRYLLERNYRSSGNIVRGALKVIEGNQRRYSKKLFTENADGPCIHIQELKDSREECRYLIQKLRDLDGKGIAGRQIAILYRTGNDAGMLMEALTECQIPFVAKEQIRNIYQHFIARNLMSYMRLASGERERRLFLDVMNAPVRYISRDSMEGSSVKVCFEDLRRFYMDKDWMLDRIDQFEMDLKMLENQTPYASIQYIRRHIGYDGYLKKYAEDHRIKEESLFEILAGIEERAKDFQSAGEWFAYIENYTKTLNERKNRRSQENGGIRLMTMHGAKGLEFDTVFIMQCTEGTIPYKKAKLKPELEEERRMFYVAMTRAKRELIITYGKEKNGKETSPSRFVSELLAGI